MSWLDREYPNTAHIVEVLYSGDVKISTIRCKELPKNRDNSKGFTQGFWDYEEARRFARHVAKELDIKAVV